MRPIAAEPGEIAGASTVRLVAAVEAIMAELAGRPAPESPSLCLELTERLGRSLDRGEAALAPLVRRVDGSGEVRRWGFGSTLAWLRHRLGTRGGRAKERLTLSRQLPRLRRTDKLLTCGDLSYGYAAAIAESLVRLDDGDAAAGETILLELAEDASVNQVAQVGARIVDVIAERDGRERPPEDARRGYRRSWIQRSRSLDGGSWVKGWLSPEHAAVWDHVIDPLTKPAGAADDRDHAERTADALFGVLSQGHRRTGALVLIDLATLEGADMPARLPSGGRIPAPRARQIALAAGVSALLLGPGGHPLYLGRTARSASPAQTRVLQARYDTCAVDSCEIPSRLCEIHHTGGGWKAGVPTDIDRLVPLCSFHNAWVEEHHHRVREHRDTSSGRFTLHLLPPSDRLGDAHAGPPQDHRSRGRGPRADGSCADGPRTDGSRVDGPCSDGRRGDLGQRGDGGRRTRRGDAEAEGP
jgi:uncharacterized protein DUF222